MNISQSTRNCVNFGTSTSHQYPIPVYQKTSQQVSGQKFIRVSNPRGNTAIRDNRYRYNRIQNAILFLLSRGDFQTQQQLTQSIRSTCSVIPLDIKTVCADLAEQGKIGSKEVAKNTVYWQIFPFEVGDRVIEFRFASIQKTGTVERLEFSSTYQIKIPVVRWDDPRWGVCYSYPSNLQHAPPDWKSEIEAEPEAIKSRAQHAHEMRIAINKKFDKICRTILSHLNYRSLTDVSICMVLGWNTTKANLLEVRNIIEYLADQGLVVVKIDRFNSDWFCAEDGIDRIGNVYKQWKVRRAA